jgi:hypothetical protein
MNTAPLFFKTFVRNVVDSCILPGTVLGSEILWLYLKQWKKEWSAIALALLSVIFLHFDLSADARSIVSQTFTEGDSNAAT